MHGKSAAVVQNDGKAVYRLTLKDVPVDGLWSISIYNAKGYSRGAAGEVNPVFRVNLGEVGRFRDPL